jgi:phytoene synthase
MREEGLDPEGFLASPQHDIRVARVVGRLLDVADIFYRRSIAGIGALPRSCRPGIHAARLIYAEIGREVERHALDSISDRRVVSMRRKFGLLATALAQSFGAHGEEASEVEPAARFLVDAIASSSQPAGVAALSGLRRRGAAERIVWLLDLFERLERRDQLARAGNTS